MKSYTDYLWFETRKHREYINITREVEKAVKKSGIEEGFMLVSAMHITAAIYVNDAESGLIVPVDEEWGFVADNPSGRDDLDVLVPTAGQVALDHATQRLEWDVLRRRSDIRRGKRLAKGRSEPSLNGPLERSGAGEHPRLGA